MRNDRYWRYGCFAVALAMVVYSVHIARLDALLRRACKYSIYHTRLGVYGLYLLFLLMAAFMMYAVFQWISVKINRKQMIKITCAAVCAYAFFAHGYLAYHQKVFIHSSKKEQRLYERMYEKGLIWDLKGLIK